MASVYHENKIVNDSSLFEELINEGSILDKSKVSRYIGRTVSKDVIMDKYLYSCDVSELLLGAVESNRIDLIDAVTEWHNQPNILSPALDLAKKENKQEIVDLLVEFMV